MNIDVVVDPILADIVGRSMKLVYVDVTLVNMDKSIRPNLMVCATKSFLINYILT